MNRKESVDQFDNPAQERYNSFMSWPVGPNARAIFANEALLGAKRGLRKGGVKRHGFPADKPIDPARNTQFSAKTPGFQSPLDP